jgi:exopolysaccharide biosynthesis WecB/TagA/CpsF family protein
MLSLLSGIRTVRDADDERELLEELGRPTKPTVLAFINHHAFNLAWRDKKLRVALASSHVLLRDGVGVELCLKRLGIASGLNSNGTDLIPLLLSSFRSRQVALFGTREPWLSRASERIRAMGHSVVASSDGFGPDSGYVDVCRQEKPQVILLGMGMPKQEFVAIRLAAELDHPCLIINGGAVLDFLADRHPRAPKWVRRVRLEWLFRLSREPKRLAGRYLVGGVHFAIRIQQLVGAQAYFRDGRR